MRIIIHIIYFDWIALRRNNSLVVAVLAFIGFGFYGIYFGKYEFDKQLGRIAEVSQFEVQQLDSLILWAGLDASFEGNKLKIGKASNPAQHSAYLTHYETKKLAPMAGLCLGQSDLFPSYYGINARDFSRQVNSIELANPMKLLSGNFDLSYVIVFLLPLLIIALMYNLYAEEKEGGTLALLRAQLVPLNMVLILRVVFRFLLLLSLSTLLIVTGLMLQGNSIVEHFELLVQWILIVAAYCAFWSLLMVLVIGLRKSSSSSAMLGLALWIMLTVVNPALINLFLNSGESMPGWYNLSHETRALNNQIWSSPKTFVLDKFYKDYPQYNDQDTLNFTKWMYAGFTILDSSADEINEEFESSVITRESILAQWQWVAPAAWVYNRLSKISSTDRKSHMEFISEVKSTHQRLRAVYYEKIFNDGSFSVNDLIDLKDELLK